MAKTKNRNTGELIWVSKDAYRKIGKMGTTEDTYGTVVDMVLEFYEKYYDKVTLLDKITEMAKERT